MLTTAISNENYLCRTLDGKRFKHLNKNLQSMINAIYGEVDEDEPISCRLTDNYIKPDIIITCQGKEAYISVKNGRATVLHTEDIFAFVEFLKSIGISEETRKTILYYQFGDKTLDGSGSEGRMNYHDVYNWLVEDIKKANKELNDRFETLEKVIDRVLFQGVDIVATPADYIYYGDVDF